MSDHQPKPNEPAPLQYEQREQRKRSLRSGLLIMVIVIAVIVIGSLIWLYSVLGNAYRAAH